MSTRPGRPLVVAGALLLAIVGATVLAIIARNFMVSVW